MRLLTRDSAGSLVFQIANEHTTDTPYAILSHTWGRDDEEVTFQDIRNGTARSRLAYNKLDFTLRRAAEDGLAHVWIDTCCINKDSYVELGEAINLMFRWYAQSSKCYVYLSDVLQTDLQHGRLLDGLRCSRWFYRGWTLQELLAPAQVGFYDRNGVPLGTRTTMSDTIESITHIPVRVLRGTALREISLPERFNWLNGRETRKAEDMSYCLLGLLDVSLPFNYGESGENARQRLLDEVEKEHGRRIANELRTLQAQKTQNPSLISEAGRITEAKILEFLEFENMYARREAIDEPYRRSCDWLLQHSLYTRWLESAFSETEDSGLLWIKGHPGAGKSTLVRFADVSARRSIQPALQISFYFNARGAPLERSTAGLYRSLLLQLFRCAPDLLTHACELLVASTTLSKSGVLNLTLKQLQNLLTKSVRKLYPRWLRCFVDALDECDINDVKEMMDVFRDLTDSSPGQHRSVSVCFASRYYPSLHIQRCNEIRLEAVSQHKGGLRSFVYNRLDLRDTEFGLSIKQQIVTKAKGVYMWAVLVVRLLNNELAMGAAENIAKVIETLPPDLDSLYRRMAADNKQGDIDKFRLCIQLILLTGRPLSAHELYHALAFAIGQASPVQIDDYYHLSMSEDLLSRYISTASRGFAELSHGESTAPATVQFIHESVRDFLLNHGGLIVLMPSGVTRPTAWSHECIKRILADYLIALKTSWKSANGIEQSPAHLALSDTSSQRETDQQLLDDTDELQEVIEEGYELAFYATTYLIYHAEESARYISQNDFLKSFDWVLLENVSNAFGMEFEPGTRILRLFAERSALRLMATAFFLRDKTDFWRFHAEYPLFDAIYSGHPAVVQEVLTWPIDANEVDRNGLTPLHSLLRSHLNASDGDGQSAGIILRSLVDRGADLNFRDGQGMTVLMRACEREEMNAGLLDGIVEYALASDSLDLTIYQRPNARGEHAKVVSEPLASSHYDRRKLTDAGGRSATVNACLIGHEALIIGLVRTGITDEDSVDALTAVIGNHDGDFSCCPHGESQCAHTRCLTSILDAISYEFGGFGEIHFESLIAGATRRGDRCGWRMTHLLTDARHHSWIEGNLLDL